jgi:small subunit ribosomal protein S1
VEKGIEGLVHVSEISEERVDDPNDILTENQEVKVQIISMDAAERKIGLSIKAAARSQEMADAQGYTISNNTGGATLGDVMRQKLGNISAGDDE